MSKKKLTKKHNKSRKLTTNLEFKISKINNNNNKLFIKKMEEEKETEGTLLTL
ncbi:hypothetical protein LguiA_034941 [Lonicera macranthoides]